MRNDAKLQYSYIYNSSHHQHAAHHEAPKPLQMRRQEQQQREASISNSRIDSSASRRVSRYSPLMKVYEEGRSRSLVISELNNRINEEVQQRVGAEDLKKQLVEKYERLLESNQRKLQEYVDATDLKCKKQCRRAEEREMLERLEVEKLHEDEEMFRRKKQMLDRYVEDVKRAVEDKEMVYRMLYKNRGSVVEEYLRKKEEEVRGDNSKKLEWMRKLTHVLASEEADVKERIAAGEGVIGEKEKMFLAADHQHVLLKEQAARYDMHAQSYNVVMKYYLQYQHINDKYLHYHLLLQDLLRQRAQLHDLLQQHLLLANPSALQRAVNDIKALLRSRH